MANGAYERLFFEEIDGKRRRVVLQGTEAPKGHVRGQPAFDLGGEVRRKLKDEPGSDEPAVHVLGIRQRDLVVRVHFRDSMTNTPGNAEKRVELVEAIRAAARPLRIVWGRTLRIGMLYETQHGVEGEGEYDSVLTFNVFSTGEAKARRRERARPLALDGSLQGLRDNLTTARTAVQVPGFSSNFASTMEELLNVCVGPLAGMLALASDILGEAEDAAYALQGAERKLQQLANQASRLRARTRNAWAFLSAAPNPGEDMASRMAWARSRADAMEALRQATAACTQVGESAERRALASGKTRFYVTRDGDTAEQIAKRFATSVATIRKLNPDLPFGAIEAGTRVVVPAGSA